MAMSEKELISELLKKDGKLNELITLDNILQIIKSEGAGGSDVPGKKWWVLVKKSGDDVFFLCGGE